jgi:hypothetical protein
MNNKTELSTLHLISDLLKDPDRKPIFKIAAELVHLGVKYRQVPRFYFSRFLFKKARTNIDDYFPEKVFDKIKPFFNDKESREVLENKLYFNFYYNQFGLSLPKILMYNHRNIFVADNKVIEVNNIQEFRSILKHIIKSNSTGDSLFVKKTFWSFGGDQIYKIHPDQVEGDPELIDRVFSAVIRSGFLFQDTIKQHPGMDRLNPSCLNTIRIDTFIDREGKIDVMSAFIRMSITNHFVDNVSSGGCLVPIDIRSGKLKKDGIQILKTHGVGYITQHPLTGTVFRDFEIPYFSEVKALVIRAAGLFPCLRLVGWDVGIGETGPVLIEGNSDYNITGNDLSDGGYRANPVFRKALKELNYL